MRDESRVARRKRRESRRRAVSGLLVFVVAIAIVPVLLSIDRGSSKHVDTESTKDDALGAVRAAIGQTVAAGSYEMDTETTSSQARTSPPQCGPSPCAIQNGGAQFTSSGHGVVNFEPSYIARIESKSTYGTNVLYVTPTNIWLLPATGGPSGTGTPLSSFAHSIVGALGPSPGALASLSLAVPGGHLNLQEEAIATATPAGEGEVRGTHVTYYDATIDLTRLADLPDLTDVERATIAYALPLLRQGGYSGTTERIGVGDDGYIREVTLTNHFTDGSTGTQHHVLSNFGCAPEIGPPEQGGVVTPVPCPPRGATPTTTTTRPSTTSAPTTVPTPAPSTSVPATLPTPTTTVSTPSTSTSTSTSASASRSP